MSSKPAIRLRGVSKCYAIFPQPIDRLKQFLARGKRRYYQEFWALRDIDLDIQHGETVGILGTNGAGKSTLLQVITGTLTPTSGDVSISGRVAALLELGTGFNPEFTGIENLRMNAAINDLDDQEFEANIDRIVEFAELGDFIHRPVKTYSSGMQARLGFAAAIHSQPDILIVDETLAVGDEAFQRKCFARIEALRDRGATILFVTHSVGTISQLCDRAVLLDHGERLLTGSAKLVASLYQRLIYAPAADRADIRAELREIDAATHLATEQDEGEETRDTDDEAVPPAPRPKAMWLPDLAAKETVSFACHGCEVSDVRFETLEGERVNLLVQGDTYYYRYHARFWEDAHNVIFGMMIRALTGVEIGGQSYPSPIVGIPHIPAGAKVDVTFSVRAALAPISFCANAGIMGTVGDDVVYLHRLVDAILFKVQDAGQPTTGWVDFMAGLPTISYKHAETATIEE